jgi:hypothetical protein
MPSGSWESRRWREKYDGEEEEEEEEEEEDEEFWIMTKEERKREVEAEPEGIPQTEKTRGAL